MSQKPSTSTRRENDVAAPAFKKAKFAWQIKGKGRTLSNDALSAACPEAPREEKPRATSAANGICVRCAEGVDENAEHDGAKRRKASGIPRGLDGDAERGRRAEGGASLVRTDLNAPPTSFSPAYMVAQCLEQFISTLNRTSFSLRRWQKKQLAKGIIDNAINKVLEEMGFTPFSLESSELLPGSINPRRIEDEGVSEAIRQRGLSSNSGRCNVSHCSHRGSCAQSLTSVPGLAAPDGGLNPREAYLQDVSCTCFRYCKLHVNGEIRGLLQPAPNSVYCVKHQVKDNLTCKGDEEDQQKDLLNAAVTFAIDEKGLQLFGDMQETV